jgi:tRNA-splicing ligase RtcB
MEPQHIHEDVPGGVPLKPWTQGVPVEQPARRQRQNAARLPIVFRHIAAMPEVHFGIGAVMATQRELVDVVHTLKQVVCVKG